MSKRLHFVGDSPAVYTAALTLAKLNLPVTIWLGANQYAPFAGWSLLGLPDYAETLAQLYQEPEQIGIDPVTLTVTARGRLLLGDGLALQQVADPQLAGISAAPLAPKQRALLGTAGALRAYFDRVKPVLTIGTEKSLAKLLVQRQGRAAAAVAKRVQAVRTATAWEEITAAAAVPGLNQALTRHGNLSDAILELAAAAPNPMYPAAGVWQARQALLETLACYAVELKNESLPAALTGSDTVLTDAELTGNLADTGLFAQQTLLSAPANWQLQPGDEVITNSAHTGLGVRLRALHAAEAQGLCATGLVTADFASQPTPVLLAQFVIPAATSAFDAECACKQLGLELNDSKWFSGPLLADFDDRIAKSVAAAKAYASKLGRELISG